MSQRNMIWTRITKKLYQLPQQGPSDVGSEVALLLLGVDVLLVTLDLGFLAGVEVAQLAEVSLPLVLFQV